MAKKKAKVKSLEIPEKHGKERKLFKNLLRTTQQFIQGRSFSPLTLSELLQRLHLPEEHKDILKEVLDHLMREGSVELTNGRYTAQKSRDDVITGVMHLHPRGFGFVKPDATTAQMQDIFIPKHLTQNAVDGDKVEVLINNESISDRGPEGRVLSVLSRARSHIAGIVREVNQSGDIYAYAPMLGSSQKILVESEERKLIPGDRIVMEVLEWGGKDRVTICRATHYIGHISDPSKDIPAAIEEFELETDFSAKAIEEAKTYGKSVSISEIRKREDFRKIECFTIDPDTAKDFDDAISLHKDSKGHYHLSVHIADVSHYVTPGSALDEEAQKRSNSTYFPGSCLPMLPKELSDNLCSLKPKVNRLTVSVIMEFDPNGDLLNYRISRSVIKSTKRFTYKEAKAVLDGKKKSPHLDSLKLMVELCGHLKRKRYERGSVEFGMPEMVVLVDANGVPTGTDYVVYDITHQMVEEFMLKANEVVAKHLSDQGKDLTYRIHEEPAEENMKDFANLAAAFGFDLSPTPTTKEVQKLFDEAMKTPYGEYLANCYIRRMRMAIYSSDNIGHFGLSLLHYCHFTSPIRRYVDLVVHRTLLDQPSDKVTLEKIASQCSEQERISAKAENSVRVLKKLRLLDAQKKQNAHKQYEAVVTRVKNFGVYFEVLELMLESYLHVSELEDDYYVFDEAKNVLTGRHRGMSFHAGDKLTVMLKDIDFITLDSKWSLVSEEPRVRAKTEKPQKSKKFKKPKEKFSKKRKRK